MLIVLFCCFYKNSIDFACWSSVFLLTHHLRRRQQRRRRYTHTCGPLYQKSLLNSFLRIISIVPFACRLFSLSVSLSLLNSNNFFLEYIRNYKYLYWSCSYFVSFVVSVTSSPCVVSSHFVCLFLPLSHSFPFQMITGGKKHS